MSATTTERAFIRVYVDLPGDVLMVLDVWKSSYRIWNRSEAIRHMIIEALKADTGLMECYPALKGYSRFDLAKGRHGAPKGRGSKNRKFQRR